MPSAADRMTPEAAEVRDRVIGAFTKLAEKITAEIATPPGDAPERLYHYTTGEGLVKILSESALRASRADRLNDPRELTYGRKLATKVLMEIASKATRDPVVRAFRVAAKAGSMPTEAWLDKVLLMEPYVACFCEEGDLLGQWTYYSQDGGYNLGFRGRELTTTLVGKTKFDLVRVEYKQSIQRRMFEDVIRQFEAEVATQLRTFNRDHWRAGTRTAALLMKVVFQYLSACMKAGGFKPEKEWRLLVHRSVEPAPRAEDLDDYSEMDFRTIGSRIIPFFVAKYESGKAPISSVTIGPKTERTTFAKLSLAALLNKNRYDYSYSQLLGKARPYVPKPSEVVILHSKISLR
jgi:hypothetical protein